MRNRNKTIDILKCIGIVLIVLAHTCESKVLLQIRSFDVPLMIVCSAFLYKEQNKFSLEYIVKRMVRLILPVWVFLSFYFLVYYFYSPIFGLNRYSMKIVLSSYLLLDGIGYVWIIRVYLLTMISLPIIYWLKKHIRYEILFYGLILIIYLLYEIIYLLFKDDSLFFNYIFYYIIPYGFVCSSVAIILKEKQSMKRYILFWGIVFILCMLLIYVFSNEVVMTNTFKYPPRIYYLSYAFFVIFVLWELINNKNIFNLKEILCNRLTLFISSHTMWIYLWHILFLDIISKKINWFVRFCIVLFISIIITFIQSLIVNKLFRIKNKIILSIFDS